MKMLDTSQEGAEGLVWGGEWLWRGGGGGGGEARVRYFGDQWGARFKCSGRWSLVLGPHLL